MNTIEAELDLSQLLAEFTASLSSDIDDARRQRARLAFKAALCAILLVSLAFGFTAAKVSTISVIEPSIESQLEFVGFSLELLMVLAMVPVFLLVFYYFLRFKNIRQEFKLSTEHKAELLSLLVKRGRQERDQLLSDREKGKPLRLLEDFRLLEAEVTLRRYDRVLASFLKV